VEDQTSLLQSSMQEDSFEVVMRGYNKRQVDDYVLQCQHHIRDLAQRLALAEQEIERVRSDAASAIEKAASKPVHEEVSERLAQILRLANEEAERERANAADEIAALKAQTLADTQGLREQAQRESEELRQRVLAETDAKREQAKAETDALHERVDNETAALRQRAQDDAQHDLEQARAEADRLLTQARDAAERDVADAHAQARDVEEKARTESERLMLAAQERAETLIGEAERRATAINTVLGTRLELLTTTHKDVLSRLIDLRSVLVDVVGKEEALGPFEVPPSPAEAAAATARHAAMPPLTDPYVQTAGEVAAAYEAASHTQQSARDEADWDGGSEPESVLLEDAEATDDVVEPGSGSVSEPSEEHEEPAVEASTAQARSGVQTPTRRLDLSAIEKSRR
jgi:chromosome segregation ATPase